jgi:hypothetical protein
MIPYENCKVLGPYKRSDGRQHVCIFILDKWKTISYPKFLMEKKLGRYLTKNETVDHKDNNKLNNHIDNFQILTRKENIQKSHPKTKWYYFKCPVCKKETRKPLSQIKRSIKKHCKGPYCSHHCAGIENN